MQMQYIKDFLFYITYGFAIIESNWNCPKVRCLNAYIHRLRILGPKRESWMWQTNQTHMVPPMGFSLSFNKMGGNRDHLDSDPLSFTLHQRLATRTLFVMQTSSGERFKLFTKHLAPNISKNLNKSINKYSFSIILFYCVICCWFFFFIYFVGLVNLFMGGVNLCAFWCVCSPT